MKPLTIKDLKQIATDHETDQIIVIQISCETGHIGLTTYGKTKEMCGHAGKLGDMAYDIVRNNYHGTI